MACIMCFLMNIALQGTLYMMKPQNLKIDPLGNRNIAHRHLYLVSTGQLSKAYMTLLPMTNPLTVRLGSCCMNRLTMGNSLRCTLNKMRSQTNNLSDLQDKLYTLTDLLQKTDQEHRSYIGLIQKTNTYLRGISSTGNLLTNKIQPSN